MIHKPKNEADAISINREINLQKMLDHPNCLRLHGICEDGDGRKVLLLDLADTTLRKQLFPENRGERVYYTPEEKIKILLDIAYALQYLHSLNIIHRDLKVRYYLDCSLLWLACIDQCYI